MTGDEVVWRAVGDREAVEGLLAYVRGLTAVRRQWAEVVSWEVVEDDGPGDLSDSRWRPVPVYSRATAGQTLRHAIRPPYWHPAQVQDCLAPA